MSSTVRPPATVTTASPCPAINTLVAPRCLPLSPQMPDEEEEEEKEKKPGAPRSSLLQGAAAERMRRAQAGPG